MTLPTTDERTITTVLAAPDPARSGKLSGPRIAVLSFFPIVNGPTSYAGHITLALWQYGCHVDLITFTKSGKCPGWLTEDVETLDTHAARGSHLNKLVEVDY